MIAKVDKDQFDKECLRTGHCLSRSASDMAILCPNFWLQLQGEMEQIRSRTTSVLERLDADERLLRDEIQGTCASLQPAFRLYEG
jgi:hypothetical protein